MQYSTGNWDVRTDNVASTSSTMSYAIPDVNRNEFARTITKDDEVQLANITSTGFDVAPEVVRFGRSKVANVYTGSDIAIGSQMATKGGLRLLVEVKENFRASNSTAEYQIPVRAWMVVQVPQTNLITTDAIDHVVGRLLGAVQMDNAKQGAIASRFLSMARGDLDPSGTI